MIKDDDDDDDNDGDGDDDDEKVFYPFSWAADPSSAAVIDLLPGFNMSHEIIMMIITMTHEISTMTHEISKAPWHKE